MLVICEDCGKKYNVDVSALKSGRGQFRCKKCNHLIVVNADDEPLLKAPVEGARKAAEAARKPEQPKPEPRDEGLMFTLPDETAEPPAERRGLTGQGLPISFHLMTGLLLLFGSMTAIMFYLNRAYLPPILHEQVNQRAAAISQVFSGAVRQPLLVGNYLQLNEEAERVSKLPGVAYVAVINSKGIVVAGILGSPGRFDPGFVKDYENKGFSREVIAPNRLTRHAQSQGRDLVVGGEKVHDVGVSLGEDTGEVHVALFTAEIDAAIRKTMMPMFYSIVALLVIGLVAFLFLGRMITKPIVELTELANKISLGRLDLNVEPRGPREVRTLALSLERMRISIQAAIKRLSNR